MYHFFAWSYSNSPVHGRQTYHGETDNSQVLPIYLQERRRWNQTVSLQKHDRSEYRTTEKMCWTNLSPASRSKVRSHVFRWERLSVSTLWTSLDAFNLLLQMRTTIRLPWHRTRSCSSGGRRRDRVAHNFAFTSMLHNVQNLETIACTLFTDGFEGNNLKMLWSLSHLLCTYLFCKAFHMSLWN